MAGEIRLFEFNKQGLLVQIAPDKVAAAKEGRRFTSLSLPIEVLFTAEQEAERDAEEAAFAVKQKETSGGQ